MVDILVEDPLEKLNVFLGVQGGAEVTFLPKEDLPYKEPWSFRLEQALTPTVASWDTIEELGESTWFAIDPSRYTWDILAEAWYRVVLTDGDSEEHPSRAVQVGNTWDRHSFLVGREICRRGYQALRLGETGCEGWLLRKRDWGQLCTACGDEITDQAVNSQCPTCFGTGFVSGYHPAFSLPISTNPRTIQQAYREFAGRYRTEGMQAVAVNFPMLRPRDIWVQRSSAERYVIQSDVIALTSVREVPLIVTFQLQKLESTDIAYSVQTPDEV